MRRLTRLLSIILVLVMTLSLHFSVKAENVNVEYLIGDWTTSDGTALSFYNDGGFSFDWGILGAEEGEWYAEPTSSDSFVIEMDGSSILSIMSMIYGTAESNYHFEVLKCNENNFYLVQVYGDYTAYSSPCKLGFTRNGAVRDFSISSQANNEEYGENVDQPLKSISVNDGEGNAFSFRPGEELEDLVLSMESDSYNPRLAHFLCIMARAIYNDKNNHQLLKDNLKKLLYNIDDDEELGKQALKEEDYIGDLNDDLTVAYSIAWKRNKSQSDIVLITIRGSWGWSWVNNAAIGMAALNGLGKHAGFELEAKDIYKNIEKLVGDISRTDVTYVITGHSQGGAAANLLSVMLHDAGVSRKRVYNYNFACPNVACLLNPQDWNPSGADNHDNIFNIGNIEDPVTFLPSNLIKAYIPRLSPLSTWGKFGRTYWFYPDSQNHGVDGHDMKHYVEELKNENSIGSFVQYFEIGESCIMRVLGIHCPVDLSVDVYSGETVAEVVNDEAVYQKVDAGVIIIIDDDEKYICVPPDQSYDVRLVGTDDGTMNYEITDIDLANEVVLEEKTFDTVELYKGKEMNIKLSGNTSISDIALEVTKKHITGNISRVFFIVGGIVLVLIFAFVLIIFFKPKHKKQLNEVEGYEDDYVNDALNDDDYYNDDYL